MCMLVLVCCCVCMCVCVCVCVHLHTSLCNKVCTSQNDPHIPCVHMCLPFQESLVTMTTEVDILSRLLADLQTSLDVPQVSHVLMLEGVLTADECLDIGGILWRSHECLDIGGILWRSQAVERLVGLVQQKRPGDCARVLLAAMRAGMPHTCQNNVAGNLERDLQTLRSLGLPLSG